MWVISGTGPEKRLSRVWEPRHGIMDSLQLISGASLMIEHLGLWAMPL